MIEINGNKLPHKKHSSMNELKLFNKPKYVYIPCYESNLKVGDYINKGQIISKKDRFDVKIISSISGHIKEIEECKIYGKLQNCYVVENDLLEKYKKEPMEPKKDFVNILEDAGIIGMGGAGFPANLKYKTDKKIETLLINAVECEPYITADYTIMREKCEELLLYIEKIMEVNKIEKAILAIKVTNKEVLEKFQNIIGKYPKIELKKVKNIYPMGWERTLIRETLKKEYSMIPIEIGVLVNNISTIFAIGEAMTKGIPLIERIITITGEGIEKNGNALVKIGTKVEDILDQFGRINENTTIISGGPMMGRIIDIDEIITPDMNCLLVLPKIKEHETPCLRCSKCVTVCPARLHPVLVKDNIKDKEKLIKLNPEKCIGCGLCSYICPARIDVRDYLKEAKEVIK